MKHKYVTPQFSNISHLSSLGKQSGAALIIIILILVLGAGSLLIGNFKRDVGHLESRNKSALVLAQAKNAILGWSLAHPTNPGVLPYPVSSPSSELDGDSDCATGSIFKNNLRGLIPWKLASCLPAIGGIGRRYVDNTGTILWYAVSSNLVFDPVSQTYPTVDSTILVKSGWIVVRDTNGVLLTDRAALILIAPGRVVSNQNRSNTVPNANQFLELINGINYPSTTNTDLEFVSSPLIKNTDENVVFNDVLTFVTIEDFVALVNKRNGI